LTHFSGFCQTLFDKEERLEFTVLERHIYFDKTKEMAWTGVKYTNENITEVQVLVKIGGEWKIRHYVLSMTVPNDDVNAVIKIKAPYKLILGYNKTNQ
jgi:hypothetical protein